MSFRKTISGISAAAILTGCTGSIPGAFRLAQQEETFDASDKIDINTKIDLLWVVDNSASMDISQKRLRDGFAGFALKYMKPSWDIRIAVITTDTYLAHPGFAGYLDTKILPNGFTSPYINSRKSSWINPPSNPTLLNTSTGQFTNCVKFGDLFPAAGPNYAKLLEGKHDGPVPALCIEQHAYFFYATTNCRVRDNTGANQGIEKCLNPASGEDSTTQCVNTMQNDSVRSRKPILETLLPADKSEAAWTQELINDFIVNVTTGSAGHGSERGLASLVQLITDNEAASSATRFFRPGSLRGIIFVTDEDDQSINIPANPPAGFTPWTGYQRPCQASRTVGNHTYTLSTCPPPSELINVASMKSQIDSYLTSLDGPDATQANYFTVVIHPVDANSIQTLQAERAAGDSAANNAGDVAVDRAQRYVDFANLVGNGSMEMDISAGDYSGILQAIGDAIIQKKSTFKLHRAPNPNEEVLVKIKHADGSETVIPSDKILVNGKDLMITDFAIVLSFAATDQILINYQPKTIY
jgi:hypothetical protein